MKALTSCHMSHMTSSNLDINVLARQAQVMVCHVVHMLKEPSIYLKTIYHEEYLTEVWQLALWTFLILNFNVCIGRNRSCRYVQFTQEIEWLTLYQTFTLWNTVLQGSLHLPVLLCVSKHYLLESNIKLVGCL